MRPSLHSVLEGSAFLTVRSYHAAVPFGFRRQVRRCFNHVRSCDVGRFQQGERMRIGARIPSQRCRNSLRCDSCSLRCPILSTAPDIHGWYTQCRDQSDAASLLVGGAEPTPCVRPGSPDVHPLSRPWPSLPPCARTDRGSLPRRTIPPPLA